MLATCNSISVILFAPYCYKQKIVKCDYVLQQVQIYHCCSSLTNIFLFNYLNLLVVFTAALPPPISSTHYLMRSNLRSGENC